MIMCKSHAFEIKFLCAVRVARSKWYPANVVRMVSCSKEEDRNPPVVRKHPLICKPPYNLLKFLVIITTTPATTLNAIFNMNTTALNGSGAFPARDATRIGRLAACRRFASTELVFPDPPVMRIVMMVRMLINE